MKKITVIIFILFIVFFGSLQTYAQGKPPGTKSEATLLHIDAIYIPCEDPKDELCIPYPAGVAHPDPVRKDHEMGLYAEGLPANTDMYIVGCITVATGGTHCTTGDQNLDTMLNSYPYGDQMVKDPTHQFKALQNPMKTDTTGGLENVVVRSFTPQSTSHSFMAYYIDVSGTGPDTTPDPSATTAPAQHQDTLDFERISPTPRPRLRVARMNVKNDPKGRFFDAKSLEPVPTGEVTLLDAQKNTHSDKDLMNPQLVKANGEFNFWVQNGIYYLSLSKPPTGYSWPLELTAVHQNYTMAYFCDPEVTDDTNSPVPLYLKQYMITENNKLVHCDVPLDPGTNPPYKSDVRAMEFTMSKEHGTTSTLYNGKVTHPLTVVTMKGEETGQVVTKSTADKLGFWDIAVEDAMYPLRKNGTPDRIIAWYQKTDLTGLAMPEAIPGTAFEPILTYVEGYAKDSAGKILPSARVGFRQQGLERVVYVATADKAGFFRIPTRYLPTFAFELAFLPEGQVMPVVVTTSSFTTQNADYLKQQGANLLTKISDEAVNPESIPQQPTVQKTDTVGTGVAPAKKSGQGQDTQGIMAVLFALFILTVTAGGIGYLIYRKKQMPEAPPLQGL